MANTADKVINMALSQVGYLEKSKSAYLADKSILYKFTEGAGSDNYTKYGKEMHDIYPAVMDFPAPWCDCFCDWVFYQVAGLANAKGLLCGDFDDYTVGSAKLYKNKNAYYKKDPKVGDQIFFNNGTRICHTGLVYKVDDSRVYTVEGNTNAGNTLVANGGGVAKKSYPLNYERIDGYGRPKYDIAAKDGWYDENNKRFYYENGVKLIKQWIHSDHHWYRVGNDGAMLIGWHKIKDSNGVLSDCYFDQSSENLGAMWHERADHNGYLELWTTED